MKVLKEFKKKHIYSDSSYPLTVYKIHAFTIT